MRMQNSYDIARTRSRERKIRVERYHPRPPHKHATAGRYHKGGASAVDSTILDLGEDLSGFLATLGQPIEQTAREMIVFELYRRSLVSSGKAAELLGISRLEFIQRTSDLGIPFFRFTEDEWQAEVTESKRP